MIDDKKIEAVAEEYNEKVEKELSKRLKRKSQRQDNALLMQVLSGQ